MKDYTLTKEVHFWKTYIWDEINPAQGIVKAFESRDRWTLVQVIGVWAVQCFLL